MEAQLPQLSSFRRPKSSNASCVECVVAGRKHMGLSRAMDNLLLPRDGGATSRNHCKVAHLDRRQRVRGDSYAAHRV